MGIQNTWTYRHLTLVDYAVRAVDESWLAHQLVSNSMLTLCNLTVCANLGYSMI